MKSKYTQDYFDFCQFHSFVLNSPFSRSQYKKHLSRIKRGVNASASAPSENKVIKPVPVLGIHAAIEKSVNGVNNQDNTGKGTKENQYYCVMCRRSFCGKRLCPFCGVHIYLRNLTY